MKKPIIERDDLVSVVSTHGDDSPRRETAVEGEEDIDGSVEPAYEELDETMVLEKEERPEPTDAPRDISPWASRKLSEIGVSLKTDQELLKDYEEKAAEDRKRA